MSKKIISLALSVLMLVGLLVIPTGADVPDIGEDINLRAHYWFNGTLDDTQRDLLHATSGGGEGVTFVEDEQFGTVLDLAGGKDEDGNYLVIPGRAFGGSSGDVESMTISAWINVDAQVAFARLFDFGTERANSFYFCPAIHNIGVSRFGTRAVINNGGQTYMAHYGTAVVVGGWHHVAIVLDSVNDTLTTYLDGVQTAKTTDIPVSFMDIRGEDGENNFYIGKSQGSESTFDGKIFDFRVYDSVKEASDVQEIMTSVLGDAEKIQYDSNALSLGDLGSTRNPRTEDFDLPEVGLCGSTITWESSNEAVVDPATGVITRPAYTSEDATVTVVLTATITSGGETTTKTFETVIPRALSPEQVVKSDIDTLVLGDLSAVEHDIDLPTEGELGSTITWESTNEAALAADGTVNRPANDQPNATGKLIATVSYGTNDDDIYTDTKEFDFTVIRVLSDADYCLQDAYAIDLGDLMNRITDIDLPTEGRSGFTTISWTSSNEDVIDPATGVVTRPIADSAEDYVTVVLTATAAAGEESVSRSFVVTVPKNSNINKLVGVDNIEWTTQAGYLPELPYYIDGNYVDGNGNETEGDQVRVNWYGYETGEGTDVYSENPPTTAEAFTNVGDVIRVKGYVPTVDGRRFEVMATVTVVEKEEVTDLPEKQLKDFNLGNVTFDNYANGETPVFKRNQENFIDGLVNKASADSMLYMFRYTFGDDNPPGEPLGGWDNATTKLRGHATGHYLSALSQAYMDTMHDEDPTMHEKVGETMEYIIDELYRLSKLSQGDPTQVPPQENPPEKNIDGYASNISGDGRRTDYEVWGEGYISAYPPDQFIMLEKYAAYSTGDDNIWAPYYTLHKILAGLISCYQVAGNEKALEIAEGMGSWVAARLNACTQEQLNRVWNTYIAGEYGGMNETMATLYEITGNEEYLDCAKMFDNNAFFFGPLDVNYVSDYVNGLANNVDTIRGRHANQHTPQIIGALKIYEVSGDYKYYEVADNFWDIVINSYNYNIGGVAGNESNAECFVQQPNILSTTLHDSTANMCETCATYNMLKLSRQLFMFTGDAKYIDYYERAWYNQIAASVDENCGNTYHIPLDGGSRKSFGNQNLNSFTCCNGTSIESNTKLQDTIYFRSVDDDALYVNLYAPSTLYWDEQSVTVKQETNFPYEDTSKITINGSGNFDVQLRVPAWANNGFTVKVNGEVVDIDAVPGSYVSVGTTWNDGDVIEVQIPFDFYLRGMMDAPNDASIFYGPILLAGVEEDSLPALHEITLNSEDLSKSITGDPSTLHFEIKDQDVQLKPFWEFIEERHSVYFDVTLSDVTDVEDVEFITTEKPAYNPNEIFTVEVTTPASVYDVAFTNEYGKDMGRSIEDIIDNGDGTVTWIINTAIGSKGDRVINVSVDEGNGFDVYGTLNVKIDNLYETEPEATPEIISAQASSRVVMASQNFDVEIVTNDGVSKLAIRNEYGSDMGKILKSRTDNGDGTVTWVYTMNIGSKGIRTMSVVPAGADGQWVDSASSSFKVSIIK